eukprot:Colp12_sorted_trinity150504_noHs@19797
MVKRRCVFAVDGTFLFAHSYEHILYGYLEALIDTLVNDKRDPTSTLEFGLVVFRDYPPFSSEVTSTYGFSDDASSFKRLVSSITFEGGYGPSSAVSEGLAAALELFGEDRKTPGEHCEDLCALICNSTPHNIVTRSSEQYYGLNLMQIGEIFHKNAIALSVFSPRKIGELQSLYLKTNGKDPGGDFCTQPQHMVLLAGGLRVLPMRRPPEPVVTVPPPTIPVVSPPQQQVQAIPITVVSAPLPIKTVDDHAKQQYDQLHDLLKSNAKLAEVRLTGCPYETLIVKTHMGKLLGIIPRQMPTPQPTISVPTEQPVVTQMATGTLPMQRVATQPVMNSMAQMPAGVKAGPQATALKLQQVAQQQAEEKQHQMNQILRIQQQQQQQQQQQLQQQQLLQQQQQ